jgi:hypothetical protein
LFDANPGDARRYGALMYALKAGERPETLKLIAEPEGVRTAGQKGYSLTFAGFMWLFMVSGVDAPYPIPRNAARRRVEMSSASKTR